MMKSVWILLLVVFFASCKKDTIEFSDVPEISYVGVNRTTAKEFSDSLVFKIHYKDGNGDLGENNADVKNLFLVDNRIGIVHEYRISQLAPLSTIAIEGDLNIVLKNVIMTNSSLSTEQVTFNIYLKDRAGNSSNTVTSETITITK